VGKNAFLDSILHPDDLPGARRFVAESMRKPGEVLSAEFRVRHADGSWRHIEAIGQNLLHEPSVGGLIANVRDVTERTRAAEVLEQRVIERTAELAAAEEQFRGAFDAAAIGMALVAPDGRVLK